MTAFAGESMARNKYTYYVTKEEGYEQIANVFLETERNVTKWNMQNYGTNYFMMVLLQIQ